MKNPILLLIAVATMFFGSNSLLSMNTNSILSSIDLKLNEKERYISTHGYISTYDWCCKIARDLVNEKRLAIMKVLGVSHQELKELKEARELQVREIDYSKQVIKFSDEINKSITNVLKNENVARILQIKDIKVNNGSISAELENSTVPIKFLKRQEDGVNLIASAKTYAVFISPDSYSDAKWWLKNSSLDCQIGHELAHILLKHVIETYCFRTIYEDNKNKISESEFNLALRNFIISTEIQADIAGVFDNIQWAKDQWNCHHQKDKNKTDDYFDGDRLALEESANYFEEIYTYMRIELEPKEETQKKPVQIQTPKNTPQKPTITKKFAITKPVLLNPLITKTPEKPTFINSSKVSKKITEIYNNLFKNSCKNPEFTKNNSQPTDPVNINTKINIEREAGTLKNSHIYKNLIKTLTCLKCMLCNLGIKKTLGLSAFFAISIAVFLNK